MSWSSDLAVVLRGLEKVARAAAGHQQHEVQRLWSNSTLKTAAQNVGVKAEEKISDIIVNKDIGPLQETITKAASKYGDKMGQLVESSRIVYSTLRNLEKEQATAEEAESAADAEDKFTNELNHMTLDDLAFMRTHVEPSTVPPPPPEQDEIPLSHSSPDITFDSTTVEKKTHVPSTDSKVEQDISKNAEAAFTARPMSQLVKSHGLKAKEHPHKPKSYGAKPIGRSVKQHLGEKAQERKVPGSRIGRVFTFGGLGVGLAAGAVAEMTRRGLGLQKPKTASDAAMAILDQSPFLTQSNAERIVNTLCRVRGAALKLGQMISIQDNSLINPELQAIFERVRQSADFMPPWQMEKVMVQELGTDWRTKLETFDDKPFAAASIGQVHSATLLDGRKVAMKIQYPGVADSINSDIDNLMTLLKATKMLPEGMHLENTMRVARMELGWECDYIREAECSRKFRTYLEEDDAFYVPEVIPELTTKQVLTTELVSGQPLDKIAELDQDTRDWIGENILRLCLAEVFEYHFMQTDPNWANFLYDNETGRITLLDFGASREYSKEFVDQYIRVIKAAALGDRDGVLLASEKLGFLTGYESKSMQNAHIDAVLILGEAFSNPGKFDFGQQNTAGRIHDLIPVMLKHRLTPPPEETYSLHRKMAGCFLLCAKLKSNIECKPLFDSIWESYKFEKEDKDLDYLNKH